VTLLGLEGGVVVRDGTEQELSVMTVTLTGDVLAATTSPTGLVPAAVPDAGIVVLVSGDQVIRVDVAGLGCPKPGRPAVFRDKVYVPCRGSGKVLVLDGSGQRGGQDVLTSGSGDPELVFDDGKLFINTPGAAQGVIVDADGTTRSVTVRSPDLPVTDPDREPLPTVPPPPPPRPEELPNNPRGQGQQDGQSSVPVTTTTTTTTGSVAGGVPGKPPGVSVSLKSRDASALVVTVSWGAVTPVTGYTVTGSGGFTGGSVSAQVAGTSTDLSIPCGGTAFCTSGRLDVSVAAYGDAGTSAATVASWSVPPAGTTTTTTTTVPPPVVTTTTTTTVPPPPVITTTTTTTVPPPPSLPSAGAAVITTITGNVASYTRTVNMAWPADWASHNGSCEIVNTTHGYQTPISCGTASAPVDLEEGHNRIVVRAYAATGGLSVDSASKSTAVREPDPSCPRAPCPIPNAVPEAPESAPMGAGGLGLIVTAALLRVGRRRTDEEGGVR
jgi:hypothetical protein